MTDKLSQVLVVDDEQHVADAISAMLGKLPDVRVSTASRGRQALSLFERQPFHLLMTDIRMPDITGLELLQQAGRLQPLCKAIVLTGYSDFAYAYEAIRMHVAAYILKSEEEAVILSEVCKALMLPLPSQAGDASMAVETIRRVKKYVAENLAGDITCTQIAAELGYSADHLARLYLHETGEQLAACIRRMKLERVEALMRDPTLTLGQISAMTGFSSRSYFNRFVKRATGRPPDLYRQAVRQAARYTGSG